MKLQLHENVNVNKIELSSIERYYYPKDKPFDIYNILFGFKKYHLDHFHKIITH